MFINECVYINNKSVHIALTKKRAFASVAIFYRGDLKGEFLKLE